MNSLNISLGTQRKARIKIFFFAYQFIRDCCEAAIFARWPNVLGFLWVYKVSRYVFNRQRSLSEKNSLHKHNHFSQQKSWQKKCSSLDIYTNIRFVFCWIAPMFICTQKHQPTHLSATKTRFGKDTSRSFVGWHLRTRRSFHPQSAHRREPVGGSSGFRSGRLTSKGWVIYICHLETKKTRMTNVCIYHLSIYC